MYMACQKGHEGVVRLLLAHAATDVNQARTDNGTTPLSMACQEGHEGVVRPLLAHAATDVNQAKTDDGATPLFTACEFGHEGVVRLLLDHGASATKCLCSLKLFVATALCCVPCCMFGFCRVSPTFFGALCRRTFGVRSREEQEARS